MHESFSLTPKKPKLPQPELDPPETVPPSLTDIRDQLLTKMAKQFHATYLNPLPEAQLQELSKKIMACKYLTVNNLNSDFIGTKGFSVVFKRNTIPKVLEQFPFFQPYLELALDPDCNAFYLNPLLLTHQSKVNPHIDRSLRAYHKTIEPPSLVSVLYVEVPQPLLGGELVLSHRKKRVGQIRPQANQIVYFQGHLTHEVNALGNNARRLSLVCEQYCLEEREHEAIPDYAIETRYPQSTKR